MVAEPPAVDSGGRPLIGEDKLEEFKEIETPATMDKSLLCQ